MKEQTGIAKKHHTIAPTMSATINIIEEMSTANNESHRVCSQRWTRRHTNLENIFPTEMQVRGEGWYDSIWPPRAKSFDRRMATQVQIKLQLHYLHPIRKGISKRHRVIIAGSFGCDMVELTAAEDQEAPVALS
jgi:hypothetical protein